MSRSSKGGWLLYCLCNIPLVWIFKVGIVRVGKGAFNRAKEVDKAMPGIPIPIMAVIIPFGAYRVEQEMHRIMRRWRVDFYKGDGHTETFILAPLFFAVPIMLAIWAIYFACIDAIFHTTILPTVAKVFFDALFWVGEYLYSKF